jgi:AI-2 transport protein TqsA
MSATPSTVGSRWSDGDTVRTVATWIVIGCGSWWLLGQLAVVLRPLLVAVFLTYVMFPAIQKLKAVFPGPVMLIVLAGLVAGTLATLAVVVYASIVSFQDDLPTIRTRTVAIAQRTVGFVERNLPWLVPAKKEEEPKDKQSEVVFAEKLVELTNQQVAVAASYAATGMSEGIVAGLFLFFLLLEASRFPDRVRAAYPPAKANSILYVSSRITGAVHGYLKAKSVSGLICAILVAVTLWFFGVKFVFLWAVLTFLCNFIPYVGSLIAFVLPATFAVLMLNGTWQPWTCLGLLAAIHVISGSVVEPLLIGKAVGMSPIVILAALTVWGSLWGLPGMFLAVPLTMVVLIVLDNIPSTRSIARLVLGEPETGA